VIVTISRTFSRCEKHFIRSGGVRVAGRIFISYRRGDTAQAADWLFDRLAGHFGQQQVVKDLDPAQLGPNFAKVIATAVASCDVLLVLIGHQWLTAAGQDGGRRLYDPHDFVRLEIEAALPRGVQVIPVLIDGARMPAAGELPPSLAGLPRQQTLELSPNRLDPDTARLLQALDQSMAAGQATQASPVGGPPTVTGPRPAGQPPSGPPAPWQQPSGPPAPGPPAPGPPAPGQTKIMPRRRPRTRTIALIACGAVAAAIAAFIALPGGGTAPSPPVTSHKGSVPKAASSASPTASPKVIVADDFSTEKINWVDDFHPTAGAYTGNGAYRLSVTGANGQGELARPVGATHGLSGVTPLNLSVSVDARKIAGAAAGYGYGIAFRSDGSGDFYAFVIQDHAVAIQKWVGNGARVQGSPSPVATSAVHASAADRLQAVCVTTDGGQAVHLEFWLNGKKLVDFTDRDHPYTKGYLGLYVQSISDTTSTAEAEFDNFAAAQL
jgi:hypothetical protein